MNRCVVYLLRIFKIFHGLMNNPVFNRNWVDTQWQQYSTHLHTNNIQNTENGTYITIKKIYRLI
jgi:hypothetical protein